MLIPKPRDYTFNIPSVLSWHAKGKGVSQFFNNLSVYFPEGEKFFIQSVRNYRNVIEDKDLQEAVQAFIRQEAYHGREHKEYNKRIEETGAPQKFVEDLELRGLKFLKKHLPESHQLAITCSLEHLTAIMGEILLRHPEYIDGSDEEMKELWEWHAYEEYEHKSVAYDVYEATIDSYFLRQFYLIISTAVFMIVSQASLAQFLVGTRQNPIEWKSSYEFQIGSGGFLWKCIIPWVQWFSPRFHPSQR